ncbi:MAG TPA: PIN domain nuclease [Blastocatellia bacterium]|jgi:predicted nucleic acid-binding protein|nr:PIN domain nuclease [Blastocatellia bacterium]
MTLVDTGPLVALIDKTDKETHRKCHSATYFLSGPMLTSWACFTEAMYLLGELRGWKGQLALWRYLEKGALVLHSHEEDEWRRVRELMEQYQDTPMDLADASLVVLAEVTGLKRIFTLDSDFYVYKINGKDSFEVVSLDSQ